MTYEQLMVELFQFSSPTYYKWKKHEKRKIFDLLEYAFEKTDLEEYIQTNKISKFKMIEEFKLILQGSKVDYLDFVVKQLKHSSEFDFFTDFYYRFLSYIDYIKDNSTNSDVEFQKVFQLRDALPSFMINTKFETQSEHEKYMLQHKVRFINNFDQNTSNFVILNITSDFAYISKQDEVIMSDEYCKIGIIHGLMFAIYKYHPSLDYQEKIKLLGTVVGIDSSIVFDKLQWKIIEATYDKIIEAIKSHE